MMAERKKEAQLLSNLFRKTTKYKGFLQFLLKLVLR
jgi:hypothetical protein